MTRIGMLALAAALWCGGAAAQERPAVDGGAEAARSVLFVGNSFFYYNNSMHSVFLDFARKADAANAARYRATSATISGSGLDWHDVDAYLRPGGGMGSYSLSPTNE